MSPTTFFSTDAATTEIYTLSLHDALPICRGAARPGARGGPAQRRGRAADRHRAHRPLHPRLLGASGHRGAGRDRSEEHTSELQSHVNLVCRLLLEKKKKKRGKGPWMSGVV